MSFKQIRNYPRDLAKPYVVVPNRDAFNISHRTNVDGTYRLTSDEVRCEFDDGGWSGGFPYSDISFTLPNYKCKKISATISGSGNVSMTVNGVEKSGVGTHTFDIPSSSKSVSIELGVNVYATPETTGGLEGYISAKNIQFLKR